MLQQQQLYFLLDKSDMDYISSTQNSIIVKAINSTRYNLNETGKKLLYKTQFGHFLDLKAWEGLEYDSLKVQVCIFGRLKMFKSSFETERQFPQFVMVMAADSPFREEIKGDSTEAAFDDVLAWSDALERFKGAPWAVTKCFLRYHLFLTTLSQILQLTPCDWMCTLTMCCFRLKLLENVFQQQLQSLGCIQRHLCLG